MSFFLFSNFVSNIDLGDTKKNKSNTSLINIFYKIIFLRVCKTLINTWKTLVNYSKMLVSFSNMLLNYSCLLFLCFFFFFSNFVSNIDPGDTKKNKSNTSLIIIFHKIIFLRVCKMLVNTCKMLVNSGVLLKRW